MRLFLAIYPPKSYLDFVRDTLRKLDKEKRNILPVPLDQIHFTVRFIGSNVSISTKQKLAKELLRHAGSYSKPEIKFENLQLGFPGQHHPRVIMYTVEETHDLHDLVNETHRAVRALDARDTILWKERDRAELHISIARLKQAAVTSSTIRRVKELVNDVDLPFPEAFRPEEMYLVQSTVTPRGPVYKRLEKIKL